VGPGAEKRPLVEGTRDLEMQKSVINIGGGERSTLEDGKKRTKQSAALGGKPSFGEEKPFGMRPAKTKKSAKGKFGIGLVNVNFQTPRRR